MVSGGALERKDPDAAQVAESAKKCGAIRQRMPRSRVSCSVHASGRGIVDACELLVDHRVDNPLYDPGRCGDLRTSDIVLENIAIFGSDYLRTKRPLGSHYLRMSAH